MEKQFHLRSFFFGPSCVPLSILSGNENEFLLPTFFPKKHINIKRTNASIESFLIKKKKIVKQFLIFSHFGTEKDSLVSNFDSLLFFLSQIQFHFYFFKFFFFFALFFYSFQNMLLSYSLVKQILLFELLSHRM